MYFDIKVIEEIMTETNLNHNFENYKVPSCFYKYAIDC